MELNNRSFAGYNDWRLPTLEEAMSLMEPTQKNGIDGAFSFWQFWIWTSSKPTAGMAWIVPFGGGSCLLSDVSLSTAYVRAVRSGQSSGI